MELFAGEEGLTRAVASLGVPCGEGIELSKGPEYDLLDPGTRQYIVGLIQRGQILCVWLGTPCSAFSIARRGVQNLEAAREKDLLGAQHAWFSSEVIRNCLKSNVAFVLENPFTSRLWGFEPVMEF